MLLLMNRMIYGEFFKIMSSEYVEFTRKNNVAKKKVGNRYEMEIKVLLGKISIEFYEKCKGLDFSIHFH